jgi:large subunit ribosomal protein L18
MSKANQKVSLRLKRKKRVRRKVVGTLEKPRLSVFRSARHVYAQVIDDSTGKTLVSVHSYKKGSVERAGISACTEMGKKLAELCKGKNVEKVVFDKNGYAYHGRVKALADGAREGGLIF